MLLQDFEALQRREREHPAYQREIDSAVALIGAVSLPDQDVELRIVGWHEALRSLLCASRYSVDLYVLCCLATSIKVG